MPVKNQGNNSLQMAITYFQTKNTCTFQAFKLTLAESLSELL